MELQWRDPRQAAAQLRRYRQYYHPPRRLPSSNAAAPPGLEAAPASVLVDSMEGGGAGAAGGGQIAGLLSAAAPSSEHASHAPHVRVAAASERAAAACSEPSAGSDSSQCHAAEPVLKLAAVTWPELEAQDAQRPPLAEMRRALRAYRKQPGDGLLHAPLRTGMGLIAEGADQHVCNAICCVVCVVFCARSWASASRILYFGCLFAAGHVGAIVATLGVCAAGPARSDASKLGGCQPTADPAAAPACEAAAAQAERLGDHAAAEAHLSAALDCMGFTASG